ncbi:MAG: hypothetical protein V1897_02985 [Pseudomonadota bacterium]
MPQTSQKIFVTDCEGPVTKNDNAAELSEAFMPQGSIFFRKISLYDDYLAEISHKQGYKAGDTLRLILPFLKAFGVDDSSMQKFSRRSIEMIPFADIVLKEIQDIAPAYIVSTSYSPYIEAVCDVIGFPIQFTFSTQVSLDGFHLSEAEKKLLKTTHSKIVDLPDISIDEDVRSVSDLSSSDMEIIGWLDSFFWNEFPQLDIYALVESVNPVGGREKAEAIREIISRHEVNLENIVYVGDSITDVEAFRLVRAGGGLAVSFNGNHWAVREASIALTAMNAFPIGWIANAFISKGLESLQDLMIQKVTPQNESVLSEHSARIRKNVRTEKIGALG